jgi:hypothetical protein
MERVLHAVVMSVAVTLMSPAIAAAQAAPPDASFVAVATAWQDAWNRHDMDALSELVAEDVDLVSKPVHCSSRTVEVALWLLLAAIV